MKIPDSLLVLVVQQQDEAKKEREKIATWLTPINYYRERQSDCIDEHQPETLQWLLESTEYQTWLNTSKKTLLCHGSPGAGKTIATATVVADLEEKLKNDASSIVIYLYCDYKMHDEQKLRDLLSCLLKQLVLAHETLPDTIKRLHDNHKKGQTRPLFKEILTAFNSLASGYSRIYILVDALDECQTEDACQSKLITEILKIQDKLGANLFLTSQPMAQIMERFKGCLQKEISASKEDIGAYLDAEMSHFQSAVLEDTELMETVKTRIIEAVGGMFLLARLCLKQLREETSPEAVRTALKQLSSGSRAYDHAYEKAMERIEKSEGVSMRAKKVLSWITCTRRPLKPVELQTALAVEVGKHDIDQKALLSLKDIVSACSG
ncbi:hypothetical protein FQN49_005405, partial [Arthroderma sp. PD_2]